MMLISPTLWISISAMLAVCSIAAANADNTLRDSVEHSQPLRLSIVWGQTGQPLPTAKPAPNVPDQDADEPQPTPVFLRLAQHVSVAVSYSDAGRVSGPTIDWVYRLTQADRTHYQLALAIDTQAADDATSVRTVLGVHLNQWRVIGSSQEQGRTPQADGQRTGSTTYRYQFVCLADRQGCEPTLPTAASSQ